MTRHAAMEGYAASDEQVRLWDPAAGRVRGSLAVAIELAGPVEPGRLAAALSTLVRRHEILRTRLVRHPALHTPLQVIEPPYPVELTAVATGAAPAMAADLAAAAEAAGSTRLSAALAASAADRATLVLAAPLVAVDRTSAGVLVAELAAELAGAPALVAPVQFADYVEWFRHERRALAQADGAAHWAAVVRQLGSEAPAPAPAAACSEAGVRVVRRALDPTALAQLTAALGATVGEVFAAACHVWSARLAGGHAGALDLAIDGRRFERLAAAVGPFTLRIPVPTPAPLDVSFRAMVAAHQRAAREHLASLESVPPPEARGVGGRRARPLFESAAEGVAIRAGELLLTSAAVAVVSPADPVRIALIERPDGARLEVVHDRSCLDDTAAARAVEELAILLAGCAADPDRPCDRLPLVGPEERARLRAFGRGPTAAAEPLVTERLAAAAARTPGALAVVDGARALSFAELDRRANQLAAHLGRLGVGRGDRVALCLGRSADAVAAAFGILRSAAAYVPIDADTLNPGHDGVPHRRLAFMLADAGVAAIVAPPALEPHLPTGDTPVILLDPRWTAVAGEVGEPPADGPAPDDVAYGIYTSGSTGQPKAVLIEHRALSNLAAALRRTVYPPGDRPLRLTLNAPMGFDPSVQQLVMMPDGHALHVVPGAVRGNGRAFTDWLRAQRVDVLDCTPPQLRLVMDAGLFDGTDAPGTVLCGGEALDPTLWRRLAGCGPTRVFNLYGPTECACDSTVAEVTAAEDEPVIGRPLPGVEVCVLDAHLEPVPLGAEGELCIAGAGVGRGYLHRPELEAARFVRDPAAPGRLYRTGDRARMRPDGQLVFLGRSDDQVKLRSHRIELGEVEARLAAVPGVAAAAVVMREDRPGERRLVGYLAGGPVAGDLRGELAAWLPDYMIPTCFVHLAQLPLTANGKVDRAALPPPRRTRPPVAAPLVLPRTSLEREMAEIWRQLLDLETIGIDDEFFELGGDSLLAMRLFGEVERLLGTELPIQVMAGRHTIAEHIAGLQDQIGLRASSSSIA